MMAAATTHRVALAAPTIVLTQKQAGRYRPIVGPLGRIWTIMIADVSPVGQHNTMADEDALMAMGQYLHQDIGIGAKSPADLARNVIALMSAAEQAALRKYLGTVLDELLPSELKGKLNRATTDMRFSSKGADAFLRAAFSQLEAES